MGDEKGKTGKPVAEQEEKPSSLPSAYDEDLMLRAAMYGVLFQAYADKASYYLHICFLIHLHVSVSTLSSLQCLYIQELKNRNYFEYLRRIQLLRVIQLITNVLAIMGGTFYHF